MPRPVILLLVAALAAAAWWIAANAGPGDAPGPSDEDGLVVHVFIADRDGKPISPAQVIQVYDEKRVKVDAQGYARLTNVTLRADEAPSAEAFTLALRLLARHHALRRGFAPTARERDDGSWEVRYALHAHGILRVHVEAVNLGPSKAYLERDEPLQRWEPVGGHAVVRPGSVVDFRIYEGWDAPGLDGKVPVRLVGEPGSDGIIGVATQRVLVDAPSPGHTAQLKLVPEPVDPIAGLVRVKEGPPPPTLRGRMIVRQIEKDGTKVHLGEIPIDDAGEFVFQNAGAGKYELVAGLDFAPGLITTECEGGDYLELETPGRARWVQLKGVGPGTHWPLLYEPQDRTGDAPFPETITDVLTRGWWRRHSTPWSKHLESRSDFPRAWMDPPMLVREDGAWVALPGPGPWKLWLSRKGTPEVLPAGASIELDLPDTESMVTSDVRWSEMPRGRVVVDVDPAGWGTARSVLIEVGGLHRRTVVKGGATRATFADLPAKGREADVGVTATWDDPLIAPMTVRAVTSPSPEPVRVRARQGGELRIRLSGGSAPRLALDLDLTLDALDEEGGRTEFVTLRRAGSEPVWVSTHAVPPGEYSWEIRLLATPGRGLPATRDHPITIFHDSLETSSPTIEVRKGEVTTFEIGLPAK